MAIVQFAFCLFTRGYLLPLAMRGANVWHGGLVALQRRQWPVASGLGSSYEFSHGPSLAVWF
jgi:hypothetical protein